MVEIREITSRGEWLQWRRGSITASRIGALFDCHPYMTRDDLAAELRGQSGGDSPAMRAGRILEPGVLVALREEHPDWTITPATTFHIDPEARFGCTPDAWYSTPGVARGIVQVKTVSPERWNEWHGRPPLCYSLQALSEMMLTGVEHGLLAVMVRSRSYPVHEFPISRHGPAEARIREAVAGWWRAWENGKLPPPASSTGLAEAFDDGSVLDLSADNEIRELLERREAAKAIAKETGDQLAEIEAAIKTKIGRARSAWLPGWQLNWPTIHADAYTVAARDYRRLTIKRVED